MVLKLWWRQGFVTFPEESKKQWGPRSPLCVLSSLESFLLKSLASPPLLLFFFLLFLLSLQHWILAASAESV